MLTEIVKDTLSKIDQSTLLIKVVWVDSEQSRDPNSFQSLNKNNVLSPLVTDHTVYKIMVIYHDQFTYRSGFLIICY